MLRGRSAWWSAAVHPTSIDTVCIQFGVDQKWGKIGLFISCLLYTAIIIRPRLFLPSIHQNCLRTVSILQQSMVVMSKFSI